MSVDMLYESQHSRVINLKEVSFARGLDGGYPAVNVSSPLGDDLTLPLSWTTLIVYGTRYHLYVSGVERPSHGRASCCHCLEERGWLAQGIFDLRHLAVLIALLYAGGNGWYHVCKRRAVLNEGWKEKETFFVFPTHSCFVYFRSFNLEKKRRKSKHV